MPRKKATPVVDAPDVAPSEAQALPPSDGVVVDNEPTLLDRFACALLHTNSAQLDPRDTQEADALKIRMRQAYRRARLMLEVREEFQ